MRLRSQRIVTPSGVVTGEVSVANGKIASVTPASGTGEDTIDVGDRWLVPGYIDTHVHGGGGWQCNTADPSDIHAMARFHGRHGTTALLATTVAAPPDELEAALRAIAVCTQHPASTGAVVLGAHLEGPFLSTARPGAMDPAMFRNPSKQLLERLFAAGQGTVRMMTLAPELPGALDVVRDLAAAGAVASIGHTDADYDQTLAASRAGAHAATHLFNAMPPFHHRHPGVLGAVLDLPEISCELICDAIHVDPAALRLAYRAKGPAAIRLVTDAMQAAGMPDGTYRLGAAAVEVRDGAAVLASSGSIAGSTLTMGQAVANAVSLLDISVEQAIALASTNPARLLGLEGRKGALARGNDADMVVLDDDLSVYGTIVGGVWTRPPEPDVE